MVRTYLPGMNEERGNYITVPICNSCRKPHFGRKNVEDRCMCDMSGNYHMGEILAETEPVTPSKDTREWEERFDSLFVNKNDVLTRWGKRIKNRLLKKGLKEKDLKDFIRKEISLAYQQGYEDGLPCSCHPEGHMRECILYPEK